MSAANLTIFHDKCNTEQIITRYSLFLCKIKQRVRKTISHTLFIEFFLLDY